MGSTCIWSPWHRVACAARLQRRRDGTLSLEDWLSLYDYQKEKGAERVVAVTLGCWNFLST